MKTLRPYHLASRSLRGRAVIARLAGQGHRLAFAGTMPAGLVWQGPSIALTNAEGSCFSSKDNTREVLPT